MIKGLVLLAGGLVKAWNAFYTHITQVQAEDTGRELQRGDAAIEESHETQNINNAESDPANVERVRQQGFRD